MTTAATLLVAAAAGLGLLNAVHFLGVTYRWWRPDTAWVPQVCRMDGETCARVVDTPQARLLGLPNAAYGAAWYLLVLAASGWAFLAGAWGFCAAFIAASTVTVMVSAWLAWTLLARLKIACVLCFLGHALNGTILVGLVWACL